MRLLYLSSPYSGNVLDNIAHALGWGVHLYTASGLALAAVIAVLLVQGDPGAFRWSFVLMAVATFVRWIAR